MTNEQLLETIDGAVRGLFDSWTRFFDGRVRIDIAGEDERRSLRIDKQMIDTQRIVGDLDWIEKVFVISEIRR